jgi:hypothetical protein
MAAKIEGLEIINGDWAVKQVIDLENDFDEATALAIGQEFIDIIKERTDNNKSVHGTNLKAYDEDYVKSEEFRAFNKSKSDVNMELTGEMLASMDVLETDGRTVTIGFTTDEDNAKAHGHMTGFNGKSDAKREFFGINNSEKDSVLSRYEPAQEETLTAFDLLQQIAKTKGKDQDNILSLFGINEDETF